MAERNRSGTFRSVGLGHETGNDVIGKDIAVLVRYGGLRNTRSNARFYRHGFVLFVDLHARRSRGSEERFAFTAARRHAEHRHNDRDHR